MLIHAAISGATSEVGQLLDGGADVNYIPNKVDTLLRFVYYLMGQTSTSIHMSCN